MGWHVDVAGLQWLELSDFLRNGLFTDTVLVCGGIDQREELVLHAAPEFRVHQVVLASDSGPVSVVRPRGPASITVFQFPVCNADG